MVIVDAADVARRLDQTSCIGLMREAMRALAEGRTEQPLRSIIALGDGDMFGIMPGAMSGIGFGAKLVSVFPSAGMRGQSHQGVIVLFDRETGAPVGVVDAGEVTKIRTACASAAATDALARRDAHWLAILGTGEQAWQHALAMPHIPPIDHVAIWGRYRAKARDLAERVQDRLGVPVVAAPTVADAVRSADIICTTTAAADPILLSSDVPDGAHVNVVGSSRAGPMEIDVALVARARFVPDHRAGVLAQGAEFLAAKAAGSIDDGHVLDEIGHVYSGKVRGRLTERDVTIYKSLGSVVQDLACASVLLDRHR